MTTNKESLYEGLIKMAQGLSLASGVYGRDTKESDLLLEIINSGVGEGYVQEKYIDLFKFSFDEEASMFYRFVREFTNEDFSYFMEGEDNLYRELAVGLDTAIEGLEEVIEYCKNDKEMKTKLKEFDCSYEGYHPFKQYGFTLFLKKLKGFRWAYFAEITKQIGHHRLHQELSA